MGKWIKQNLVFISGILLPALLVLGFFILERMPRTLSDPPAYDFLLAGYHYDYQHPADFILSFEVRDGRLRGRASPRSDDNAYTNRQFARLFRYRSGDERFEEIVFDLPEGLDELKEPLAIDLPEAENLQLDKRAKSPDGFQFEFMGYRGRGGLLGEIFGMSRSHESNYVLKKDSVYIDLPNPSSEPYQYQNDLHFLGWVLAEDSGP